MGAMNVFKYELSPFAAFNKHHHGKKNQHGVVRNANKHVPNKQLLDEKLHPNNPTSA